MKRTNQSVALLFATIIVAVISIVGCASTGIERSKEARTTMKTVDNDIKLIVALLDATDASLNELTRSGQSDAKMAFDLYTANIEKIVEMEEDFGRHADEMKDRGEEYFEEWQKEGDDYKNPQIRELSEQRRMELIEIYKRIPLNSIGVKEAFKAYVSDAKEIQIYLSNDLTSKGIEAIAPLSRRVASDGDTLKYAIKTLEMSIERARAEMSQSGR
ncbi:MAG: DUF2959 family protein [Desulfosalsimonadaceae bacterium]|nr:DUF2959 family protein [Desulfosalsimonadaceae bacterium]